MEINQVYWDHNQKIVSIVMKDGKIILLLFKYQKGLGNKFLSVRQIIDIYVYNKFYITGKEGAPIRDIQKFIKLVVLRYKGRTGLEAWRWLEKMKKKTTKE